MDLTTGEIRTIVWATGYRPDYSWLHAPVLDRKARSVTTVGSPAIQACT
jgi:putative flavoprotein involved in K+ transport